jgi:hypothetical protein
MTGRLGALPHDLLRASPRASSTTCAASIASVYDIAGEAAVDDRVE